MMLDEPCLKLCSYLGQKYGVHLNAVCCVAEGAGFAQYLINILFVQMVGVFFLSRYCIGFIPVPGGKCD